MLLSKRTVDNIFMFRHLGTIIVSILLDHMVHSTSWLFLNVILAYFPNQSLPLRKLK
jgi:hypothetical protein